MSPQQMQRIFSDVILRSSVRVINFTGGEPTVRQDLVEAVRVLADTCTGLQRIDMPTNGLNAERVVDQVEQLLAFLLPRPLRLSVTVSLDGVGEVHERVRQIPGSFALVDRTVDGLRELTDLYPALSFGLNATIGSQNYADLLNLRDYAVAKKIGINFTLAALSEIGVESLPMASDFQMNAEQKEQTAVSVRRLKDDGLINPRYARALLQWLADGVRRERCAFRAGEALLMEPDGRTYACGNFKEFYIGNVLEKPFAQLLRGKNGGFKQEYARRCGQCNSNCYSGG